MGTYFGWAIQSNNAPTLASLVLPIGKQLRSRDNVIERFIGRYSILPVVKSKVSKVIVHSNDYAAMLLTVVLLLGRIGHIRHSCVR